MKSLEILKNHITPVGKVTRYGQMKGTETMIIFKFSSCMNGVQYHSTN